MSLFPASPGTAPSYQLSHSHLGYPISESLAGALWPMIKAEMTPIVNVTCACFGVISIDVLTISLTTNSGVAVWLISLQTEWQLKLRRQSSSRDPYHSPLKLSVCIDQYYWQANQIQYFHLEVIIFKASCIRHWLAGCSISQPKLGQLPCVVGCRSISWTAIIQAEQFNSL